MPDLNQPETGDCPFCDRASTSHTFLYEGRDFYIIADHAPIAEAHLLLIPRDHYPHLAALPPQLHEEFESLKSLIGEFITQHYGALTFWENGIFGQSVPHAHLHAISVSFDPHLYIDKGPGFSDIAGMQSQHDGGHYFMIEQQGEGRLLPPDWDLYLSIVTFARNTRPINWRFNRDERLQRAGPILEAVKQRWHESIGRLD